MKSISLNCTEGSSNKEYHIQLESSGEGFVVNFQYGAIGQALKAGTKTPTPLPLEKAEKVFNSLLNSKLAKQYRPVGGGGESKVQALPANVVLKEVIILPQLLNEVEDEEKLERLLTDDNFLAQEKKDGERRLTISGDRIIGLNKKGTEVPLAMSIIEGLDTRDSSILDGEIIGETLHVFDLLALNGKDLTGFGCEERIEQLDKLKFKFKNIQIVYRAHTTEEKRALLKKLIKENREGIVFKKRNAPYEAGRPSSGGNQFKFKFQKTATFIVSNHTEGKRSVGLELIDGDTRVFVGKVTIPPNKEIPQLGELVEVQYLYAFRGGSIFQPVYLNPRTDSDLTDATMKQLIYKAEEEIV